MTKVQSHQSGAYCLIPPEIELAHHTSREGIKYTSYHASVLVNNVFILMKPMVDRSALLERNANRYKAEPAPNMTQWRHNMFVIHDIIGLA